MTSTWKNRIVGYGEDKPENLLANPKNWRRHPAEQQDALAGAMREVGYVQAVIVNRSTGFLVDGHCRVEQAMRAHQESIPVVYVELSKEDDRRAQETLLARLNAEGYQCQGKG